MGPGRGMECVAHFQIMLLNSYCLLEQEQTSSKLSSLPRALHFRRQSVIRLKSWDYTFLWGHGLELEQIGSLSHDDDAQTNNKQINCI